MKKVLFIFLATLTTAIKPYIKTINIGTITISKNNIKNDIDRQAHLYCPSQCGKYQSPFGGYLSLLTSSCKNQRPLLGTDNMTCDLYCNCAD